VRNPRQIELFIGDVTLEALQRSVVQLNAEPRGIGYSDEAGVDVLVATRLHHIISLCSSSRRR
jgi:hypothetical protein